MRRKAEWNRTDPIGAASHRTGMATCCFWCTSLRRHLFPICCDQLAVHLAKRNDPSGYICVPRWQCVIAELSSSTVALRREVRRCCRGDFVVYLSVCLFFLTDSLCPRCNGLSQRDTKRLWRQIELPWAGCVWGGQIPSWGRERKCTLKLQEASELSQQTWFSFFT